MLCSQDVAATRKAGVESIYAESIHPLLLPWWCEFTLYPWANSFAYLESSFLGFCLDQTMKMEILGYQDVLNVKVGIIQNIGLLEIIAT